MRLINGLQLNDDSESIYNRNSYFAIYVSNDPVDIKIRIYGVPSSQILHLRSIFNLNRGCFIKKRVKMMFVNVQVDSYFVQPSARKKAFFAPFLFSRTSPGREN